MLYSSVTAQCHFNRLVDLFRLLRLRGIATVKDEFLLSIHSFDLFTLLSRIFWNWYQELFSFFSILFKKKRFVTIHTSWRNSLKVYLRTPFAFCEFNLWFRFFSWRLYCQTYRLMSREQSLFPCFSFSQTKKKIN